MKILYRLMLTLLSWTYCCAMDNHHRLSFSDLPNELQLKVFSSLTAKELLQSPCLVSNHWHALTTNDYLWKSLCQKIYMTEDSSLFEKPESRSWKEHYKFLIPRYISLGVLNLPDHPLSPLEEERNLIESLEGRGFYGTSVYIHLNGQSYQAPLPLPYHTDIRISSYVTLVSRHTLDKGMPLHYTLTSRAEKIRGKAGFIDTKIIFSKSLGRTEIIFLDFTEGYFNATITYGIRCPNGELIYAKPESSLYQLFNGMSENLGILNFNEKPREEKEESQKTKRRFCRIS